MWVYSDDPAAAHALVAPLVGSNLAVMQPPKNSTAAESLLLMGQAVRIVSANSTMSWWAGRLSVGAVAIPTPFFRTPLIGGDLAAVTGTGRHWIPVHAHWEHDSSR